MAATDDLVSLVLQEIKQRIDAYISTLIAADHERHDRLCGTIIGLKEATTLLEAQARKYRLNDFDPEDEPPLPFMPTKQKVRA